MTTEREQIVAVTCKACDGRGSVFDDLDVDGRAVGAICERCNGHGYVRAALAQPAQPVAVSLLERAITTAARGERNAYQDSQRSRRHRQSEGEAMSDIVERLRKQAWAVYLACEESVAADIAKRSNDAADEITRLRERIVHLERVLEKRMAAGQLPSLDTDMPAEYIAKHLDTFADVHPALLVRGIAKYARDQRAKVAHLERVQEAADAMRACGYPSCELCKRAYDAVKGEG